MTIGGRTMPELLAPAQDFTCLHAAIAAGCDAVYIGLDGFNMRQAAGNFTLEELGHAVSVCRDASVRIYLALNTIVFTDELARVRTVLERAAGLVDAIVCWDPAVVSLCRELGHAIHVSTQASVASVAAARFYKSLGAERVVPARECTLDEVVAIREEAEIEVECFIHGAMCVNYSGRCFLSQDLFNRSANRGDCLQPCRREYVVKEVGEEVELVIGQDYVMSAKDLCTLPFIDTLIDAGIDAFKVEGRNRSAEYVDTTVRCYREALDAHAAGCLDKTLKAKLVDELRRVFNRGFSDGFYHGRSVSSFTGSSDNQATHRKEFVGIVSNYYAQAGVMEVAVQSNTFSVGDEVMVQGPTTGVLYFSPKEIRQEDIPVSSAPRGRVTVKLAQKVRRGDKVFVRVPREGKRAGE